MNEREALRLALEALESVYGKGKRCEAAITAIKQVMGQPEPDHVWEKTQQALERKAENARELGLDYEPENTLHWHSLNYRTASTQNAQAMFEALEKFVETAIKQALEQPEQKPVASGVIRTLVNIDKDGNETWKEEPFYTSPPKREWQGLTDEEFKKIMRDTYNIDLDVPGHGSDDHLLWRAIESKLKEKNSA